MDVMIKNQSNVRVIYITLNFIHDSSHGKCELLPI